MYKKIILILLLAALTGCSYKIPPKLNIHIQTQATESEAKAIVGSLYEGFDNFINCEHLMLDYPEQYVNLLKLQENIYIKDMKGIHTIDACGMAFVDTDTIYLNPDMYNSEKCDMFVTVPHEILHLIGFSHKNDEKLEEFYRIFWECKF